MFNNCQITVYPSFLTLVMIMDWVAWNSSLRKAKSAVNALERKHGQWPLLTISRGYHHLVMEEHFVPNVPGQTCKRKIQSSIVINRNPSWKEKNNNNNCIPLSTGLIFIREKPPLCHLHIVSMKASKRLEKYKLGFLKDEKLSVLLYLFTRFFNYHVHLSYHQSVPSYLKIRRSRYLAKPSRLTKLFQMILSTKSHFDKTLTVIFKCGYCI